ncbi:MAG: CAP domain-containing protein [Henriciella sp.]
MTAQAETVCDLRDGYGEALVSYVQEVEACLETSNDFVTEVEADLAAQTNAARSNAGLAPLIRRDTLDKAARAHAIDMAARNYAGHTDLEGRGHVYRMRAIDRKMLTGATGANVVVMAADASSTEVFDMITSDPANRENLTRETFTDTGIGVARAGDTIYVVQMLTTVDGELDKPMPLSLADATSFQPNIREGMFRTAGWSLGNEAGKRLAGGSLMRVHADNLGTEANAYLDVLVELNADTYVLKGPIVSVQ